MNTIIFIGFVMFTAGVIFATTKFYAKYNKHEAVFTRNGRVIEEYMALIALVAMGSLFYWAIIAIIANIKSIGTAGVVAIAIIANVVLDGFLCNGIVSLTNRISEKYRNFINKKYGTEYDAFRISIPEGKVFVNFIKIIALFWAIMAGNNATIKVFFAALVSMVISAINSAWETKINNRLLGKKDVYRINLLKVSYEMYICFVVCGIIAVGATILTFIDVPVTMVAETIATFALFLGIGIGAVALNWGSIKAAVIKRFGLMKRNHSRNRNRRHHA